MAFTPQAGAGAVSTLIDASKVKFLIELNIGQPEIIFLNSAVNNKPEFSIPLFLKEGYAITLELKMENGKLKPVVSGEWSTRQSATGNK